MSAIPFDPASSSGNPTGARAQSRTQSHAADQLSFDALLARSQSRHESESVHRSRDVESREDYDYGTSRSDDIDEGREKDASADTFDDDYRDREDDDSNTPSNDSTVGGYSEATYDDSDPAYEGTASLKEDAAPSDEPNLPQDNAGTVAAVSSASSPGEPSRQSPDRQGSGGAATVSPAKTTAPAAQPAAAQGAAGAQQQSQTTSTAAQASNISASVSNNALLSQTNTALTDGSAVVALQSVDGKASGNGTRAVGPDNQTITRSTAGLEGAEADVQTDSSAQLAKLRQAREAAQTPVVQGAAGNGNEARATIAQTVPPGVSPTGSAPNGLSTGIEGATAASTAQPAGQTTTAAFSSLAPVGGVTQAAHATAAGAAASGNASSGAAAPSEQVAVEIHKGIATGKDSITIRLNPAELGKIDVKMELSDDGSLRAVIAVDKAETLDLLQKDVKGLERALQNAGLQTDSGSLNFSLRGEGGNHANEQETASGNRGSTSGPGDEAVSNDPAAQSDKPRQVSHDGSIDISV